MSNIEKAKQEVQKWEKVAKEKEAQINRGHWSSSVEREYARAKYKTQYWQQGLSYLQQGAAYKDVQSWVNASSSARLSATPVYSYEQRQAMKQPQDTQLIQKQQVPVQSEQKLTQTTQTAYRNPFTGETISSSKPIPGWTKIKVTSAGKEVVPTAKEVFLKGYSGTQYTPVKRYDTSTANALTPAPIGGYGVREYDPDIPFSQKVKSTVKDYASLQPQRNALSELFGTGKTGRPTVYGALTAASSPLNRFNFLNRGDIKTERYYGGSAEVTPDWETGRIERKVPDRFQGKTSYEKLEEEKLAFYGGANVRAQKIVEDLTEEKVSEISSKYESKLQQLYDEGKLTKEKEKEIQKQYEEEIRKEVKKEFKNYEPELKLYSDFTSRVRDANIKAVNIPKLVATSAWITTGIAAPAVSAPAIAYEGFSLTTEGVAEKKPAKIGLGLFLGVSGLSSTITGINTNIAKGDIKDYGEKPFKTVGKTKRIEGDKEITELFIKKSSGNLKSEGTLRQITDTKTGFTDSAGRIKTSGELSWNVYGGKGTGFADLQIIRAKQLTATVQSGKDAASFGVSATGTKGASGIWDIGRPATLKITSYADTSVNPIVSISRETGEGTYAFISGKLTKANYLKSGESFLIQSQMQPTAYGFVKDISDDLFYSGSGSGGGGVVVTKTTQSYSPFFPSQIATETKTSQKAVTSPISSQITRQPKPSTALTKQQQIIISAQQQQPKSSFISSQPIQQKVQTKSTVMPFFSSQSLSGAQKPKLREAVIPALVQPQVPELKQESKLVSIPALAPPSISPPTPSTADPGYPKPNIPIIPPGFDFRLGGGSRKARGSGKTKKRQFTYSPTLASIFTGFTTKKTPSKTSYTGFEVFRPVPERKYKSIFI